MKKILCLTVLALALSCTRLKAPMEPQAVTQVDEYAVYSTALNNLNDGSMQTIVMPDSTVDFIIERSTYILDNMPGLEDETLVAFNQVNSEKKHLLPIANLTLKCYLANRRDIPAIYDLKTKYPDAQAIVELSRVGFNGEKTQALVYISTLWAPLAGVGNLVFLVKENTWQVKKTVVVWIS
jgi:hypothetical protein